MEFEEVKAELETLYLNFGVIVSGRVTKSHYYFFRNWSDNKTVDALRVNRKTGIMSFRVKRKIFPYWCDSYKVW